MMILETMYLFGCVISCHTSKSSGSGTEKILLRSVRYGFNDNAIKMIDGEPEVWIQRLIRRGDAEQQQMISRTPRDYTTLGIHVKRGLVFWYEKRHKALQYSSIMYNTSGVVRTIKENVQYEIEAITIDWIDDKVYWSEFDTTENTCVIFRASIYDPSDTMEIVVHGGLERVTGLEIIPQLRYLFIADAPRKSIERINVFDNRKETFSLDCSPWSLSVDFGYNKILVLCHGPQTGQINSYNFSGGDEKNILTRRSLLKRGKLDTYQDLIFLTNNLENGFEIISRRSGMTLIDATLPDPGKTQDIKMFAPEKQPSKLKKGGKASSPPSSSDWTRSDYDYDYYEFGKSGRPITKKINYSAVLLVATPIGIIVIIISAVIAVYVWRRLSRGPRTLDPSDTGDGNFTDRVNDDVGQEIDESQIRINLEWISARPVIPAVTEDADSDGDYQDQEGHVTLVTASCRGYLSQSNREEQIA